MNTGIVHHHDSKGIQGLLGHKVIEGFNDDLGGDRVSRRMVNQSALTTQEAQHIQTLTA